MGKGTIAIVLWLCWALVAGMRLTGAVTGLLIVLIGLVLLIAAVIATVRAFRGRQPGLVADPDDEVDYEAAKYRRLEQYERKKDGAD